MNILDFFHSPVFCSTTIRPPWCKLIFFIHRMTFPVDIPLIATLPSFRFRGRPTEIQVLRLTSVTFELQAASATITNIVTSCSPVIIPRLFATLIVALADTSKELLGIAVVSPSRPSARSRPWAPGNSCCDRRCEWLTFGWDPPIGWLVGCGHPCSSDHNRPFTTEGKC